MAQAVCRRAVAQAVCRRAESPDLAEHLWGGSFRADGYSAAAGVAEDGAATAYTCMPSGHTSRTCGPDQQGLRARTLGTLRL